MPAPTGRQAIIDQRRSLVARLTLHKLTQREIVDKLYHNGIRNPVTGNPYTVATVNRDLQRLRQDWRQRAAEDIDARLAEHLVELEEVRRAAWVKEDLHAVLKALKQEAEILGLDAPVKTDVTTKGESLNERRHAEQERTEALVSITDAFRAGMLRPDRGGNGSMVAEEHATGSGGILPG